MTFLLLFLYPGAIRIKLRGVHIRFGLLVLGELWSLPVVVFPPSNVAKAMVGQVTFPQLRTMDYISRDPYDPLRRAIADASCKMG